MTGQWVIQRRTATLAAAVAMLLFLALGVGGAGAASRAHAARTVNIDETARLHLVSRSGSTLNERGTASGTLPGTVSARFKVTVVVVTGSVTIYPRGGGSLTIKVLGVPQSAGTVAKFSGTLTVTGGSGRYAHARGSGTFTSTVNRRTWAGTVHTNAKLTY
jgi:hypothetical protein